jgi:TRAP-type transport system periplasmic protein
MLPRKLFLANWVGALAAIGAAAASVSRASAADSYTFRMSTSASATTPWTVAATRLAAAVGRRSNGRLKIEVYPNAQLANQHDSIVGLTTGLVDLTIQASVFSEPEFPQLQVLSLPFMFKDIAAAYRVLDGPIGGEFAAAFATKGILGFGWGSSGVRELETVSKPVRSPEDMRGLRFRIQGGAVNVAMAQALGSIPVTIDVAEVYTSLMQHTIDAVDSSPDGVMDQKSYMALKYLALTHHLPVVQPILGSKSKIDALPADLQQILREEAKAVIPPWRAAAVRAGADAMEALKGKGMILTEIDYPAFRKAMDPVYTGLQSRLGGDLVQRVSRAANAA